MHVRLYCDGGCLGKNPSPAGVYFSVAREHEDRTVERLVERKQSTEHHTNNEAEYLALTEAFVQAGTIKGLTSVTIHSDSQLIVHQFSGRWQVTEGKLQTMLEAARARARELAEQGVLCGVVWVPRKENVRRLGH